MNVQNRRPFKKDTDIVQRGRAFKRDTINSNRHCIVDIHSPVKLILNFKERQCLSIDFQTLLMFERPFRTDH